VSPGAGLNKKQECVREFLLSSKVISDSLTTAQDEVSKKTEETTNQAQIP
jgi:hypothetical protein